MQVGCDLGALLGAGPRDAFLGQLAGEAPAPWAEEEPETGQEQRVAGIGGGILAAAVLTILVASPAAAHETREVGDYHFVVGFINEPVFTNQKSGLEFMVTRNDQPVEGLAETLQAEVVHGDQRRELQLSPRFGAPGWYQSVFFPTAAGSYTFRIHGSIEGQAVDESFTSGPETFNDVEEATSGQFPVVFPPIADLVRSAEAGARAETLAIVALVVGGAGLLIGVAGLGLAIARRRQ